MAALRQVTSSTLLAQHLTEVVIRARAAEQKSDLRIDPSQGLHCRKWHSALGSSGVQTKIITATWGDLDVIITQRVDLQS